MQPGLDNSTEHSIGSCYTVVYDFSDSDRTWQVAGTGGWSELHICQDDEDESYRILAWTHETQEVLVNVNLDYRCEYKEKSDNFHSFKDGNLVRRGFGFHKSDRNLQSARDFLEVVRGVITELRRSNQYAQPAQNRAPSMVQTVPALPNDERNKPPELMPDGTLKIHEACQAKTLHTDVKITDPREVKRAAHVEFDESTGEYIIIGSKSMLPDGWEQIANQKFNVPPNNLPGILLEQYNVKIPLLLEQIKHRLIQLGGLHEKGIFRLAPDASECNRIKELMNTGQEWQDIDCDVNVLANLLKIWFRDMPNPILNCVDPAVIEMNHDSVEGVANAMTEFPEPERTLMFWLWDFCCEVADNSQENKMGVQNLGIVIGPNLFNTDNFLNPMKAMNFSAKVVAFFQKGVEWRQINR